MAKQSKPSVLLELSKMDRAYSTGNKSWFDFLDDDVTIYVPTKADPIKGRVNYTKNFSKLLVGTKRKLEILSRNVQAAGDVFIVYQVVRVTENGVAITLKQSQVWEQTKKGLKINHFHSSALGNPQSLIKTTKLSSINVINERIATIAASVGVAQ